MTTRPSELHARILTEIDVDDEDNHGGFRCRSLGILRAVVELHAPSHDGNRWTCDQCASPSPIGPSWDDYPCETTRSIAAGLGVETP